MAPDLNSVPASPNNHTNNVNVNNGIFQTPAQSPIAIARRESHMTGTPLIPGVTSSGFHQHMDDSNTPMRHPQPMTAAQLHFEMEKESEAVVNRLSRELSALRQQTVSVASVASNASSSSAADHTTSSAADPPATRRHRSSSSVSTRSITAAYPLQLGHSTSQASVERARDAAGIRSRENSLAGAHLPLSSRSRAPSASPSPNFGAENHHTLTSSRYEEMERARTALEIAKRENEVLSTRVRELETQLRERDEAVVLREQSANGLVANGH